MTPVAYRRLPGLAVAPFRRQTLWMGPDHVLSVRTLPFSEHYRRYYFSDIQAIVLTESGSPMAYYLYASAVFLLLMFLLLGYTWHPVWATLCGIAGAVLLTLGLRVPNCACYLQTATGVVRLPSLGRLRAARKTLAILKAAIEASQGRLT
jgi:hypothetical protein